VTAAKNTFSSKILVSKRLIALTVAVLDIRRSNAINTGPAHRPQRTVLDALLTPTDPKA
jgi:hypothetical protein